MMGFILESLFTLITMDRLVVLILPMIAVPSRAFEVIGIFYSYVLEYIWNFKLFVSNLTRWRPLA